jgi:hypothetical protein
VLGLLESEEEMVSHSLEQHLKELGLLPEKKPARINYIDPPKIPFNDPRDPVTGEVPF